MYLVKRHNTYYCHLNIPKDVQEHFGGKTRFYASTKSSNKLAAERAAFLMVHQWKNQIEQVRDNTPSRLVTEAMAINEAIKGGSPIYHVQDIMNEEVMPSIRAEFGEKIADDFELMAYGKAKPLAPMLAPFKGHELGRGLVAKTVDQMEKDVSGMVASLPTIRALTDVRVRNWIVAKAETEELTPSSVTRIMSNCRAFFRYLQHMSEVPEGTPTPFTVPTAFKQSKKKNAKIGNKILSWVPFGHDDLKKLYQAVGKGRKESRRDDAQNDDQLRTLIAIGSYTGARIEEICSMKIEHVSLAKETISITDSKTDAGIRTIPIHHQILPLVTRLTKSSTDGYLISGLTFNMYDDRSNAIGKRFGRLKVELGYSDLHVFHSIRKTVVTALENAGVTENVTADIVGHDKPRITYGLYSGGATMQVKREALAKLDFGFAIV
jgi:integrase